MQQRTGMKDVVETFGRRAIRSFMPDQHRTFFAQLPFMVVGSVDSDGWPWASIVTGKPGFASSPDETTLKLTTRVAEDDPLKQSIRLGTALGLLGIELPTRRRNRVNARITKIEEDGFAVTVDQSFGNCPQYIQTRTLDRVPNQTGRQKATRFTVFGEAACKVIQAADTLFVSSYIEPKDCPKREGVDVSHRGGLPGFVKVAGNTLTIPDYTGNFLFNTIGNFLVNPKAGLVFVDFDTGDLWMMTGQVDMLWEDAPEVKSFKGAERAWRFRLERGIRIHGGFPFHTTFGKYSPNSEMTDSWPAAEKRQIAESRRAAWRPYTVLKTEQASEVIKSFYLQPSDGHSLLPFEAGQYVTLKVTPIGQEKASIRTYTVSSAPGDPYYRISVKREPDGLVSNNLHDHVRPGTTLDLRAPRGDFFIDPAETRPAVLMAGGVGVTPMLSMASHIANEGIRTRYTRSVTVFHATQTTGQRAFYHEFTKLAERSNGAIRYFSFIEKAAPNERPGRDFHGTGYLTKDMIRQALPLDDYDFFLCGPPPFMQALYDILRSLGVRDGRIFAEAFGPASLRRRPDEGIAKAGIDEAEHAIIRFTKSDFEQRWNAGDPSILEVAEDHGLSPNFGCRTGACGSCAVTLKSGKVAYRTEPAAEPGSNEVLICCAVPAKGSNTVEIDL